MNNKLSPLEALEKLRQNYKDDTHLFDDELLNIVEKELILLNALRNKLNRKIETKEYKNEASNSYRITTLLTYELEEQWDDMELQALKQFLLNLSGISKELKALEIIKREAGYGISFDGQSSDGIYGVCIDGYIECNKDEYDLLKEVLNNGSD